MIHPGQAPQQPAVLPQDTGGGSANRHFRLVHRHLATLFRDHGSTMIYLDPQGNQQEMDVPENGIAPPQKKCHSSRENDVKPDKALEFSGTLCSNKSKWVYFSCHVGLSTHSS